jgi:hypothetical protein
MRIVYIGSAADGVLDIINHYVGNKSHTAGLMLSETMVHEMWLVWLCELGINKTTSN